VTDMCKCSHCGADLRGPTIPNDYRYMHGNLTICEYGCGGEPHYSRLISIYDRQLDRTIAWQCPDCGHEEDRHA
jgi:DNA-directed RNA polymerase subunit RPC12/RpoP